MDGMDGDEVLEWLKALSRGVYVVMMTGSANREKLDACFKCGADDFIIKPLCKDDLIRVLEARRYHLDRWKDAMKVD